jgi:histidinol dehydrogenase
MNDILLPERTIDQLIANRRQLLDDDTRRTAREIIARVQREGEPALLELAREFGDWNGCDPWWFEPSACQAALASIDPAARADLEAMADRIRYFATAQRAAVVDVDVPIPGGRAGHSLTAIESVGCYAPGGRFPLPSSVLMTAITARVAGVGSVWLATPHPSAIMLAAAAIAEVDGVLGIGGVQAIAAMTFGVGPVPRCDAVVGPGNRYVTAAKEAVAGHVTIDSLAGPSELVVVADDAADPRWIAADLIAQAEHDPEALPVLITTSASVAAKVREAFSEQLIDLPTAAIARASLRSGGVVVVTDRERALEAVNLLAPEHLELMLADAEQFAAGVDHAGAVFLGSRSAEAFGDYGAGPNHVLPTAGGSRIAAGLSVFTFLRARTWLRIDDPAALAAQTARLARLEGLEGHARAAELRMSRGA